MFLVQSLDGVKGYSRLKGWHRARLACEEYPAIAQRCVGAGVQLLTILCWALSYRPKEQQVKHQTRIIRRISKVVTSNCTFLGQVVWITWSKRAYTRVMLRIACLGFSVLAVVAAGAQRTIQVHGEMGAAGMFP
jgi:hypothetical protein